ncbi:hypothetical protein PPL_08798 [Heterostelium album PN500]|uniref:Uncharacterized protein n=1 Tax=Heterostelium pallidum (strain ATCC 26659 / Pp 5 / PN500) TaxID=670386 RepID=D3BJR8_HETP5|nr:hypothetical protein PPL_08798 [Heterostelium album PN500]EFA78148.1 hypothetical protein PPL_08798 [Heterostelium album PN500]|eukprot:XP_020430274.1 hypothetical protein PPL_08798 [Heterostelium album PN500]
MICVIGRLQNDGDDMVDESKIRKTALPCVKATLQQSKIATTIEMIEEFNFIMND